MANLKYEKKVLSEKMSNDGKNTYGKLVTGPTMSLEEVADEIAHITGMQEMACANVIKALPTVIHHFVRGGLGVNLGFATLKPSIKTTATTEDGTIEVKRRRLTMRLSTQMKSLLEQIKVSVKSDGTVEDDEDNDDSTSSSQGNDNGNDNQNSGSGDSGSSSSSSGSDSSDGGDPDNEG